MNLLILVMTLWGCAPEYVPKPFDPTDWIGTAKCDTTLKLVWQKPIVSDTSNSVSSFYMLGGKLIYEILTETENSTVMGYFNFVEKEIVYLNRLQADSKSEVNLFLQDRNKIIVNDGILSYSDGRRLYGLNENAEIFWKFKPDGSKEEGYGDYFLSNYNDLVFFPSNNQDVIDSTGFGMPCYILGVDIKTGSKKTLFTESEQRYFRSQISPPVALKNNGDLIMVFQIRKYNFLNGNNRTDIVSWNLTQNRQLWRLDSLDRMGISSANPLLYENGKVYYAANSDIYCLDPLTGKEIWKQSFPNFAYHFQTNNLLLTEKGLIVKSNDHEICLLNKESGQIQWENRDVGTSPNQLFYFKGDVFFNCGDGTLQCVNINSGLIKFKMKSPNNCIDDRAHYGINQFIINPENNLLYISDNFFIQCFELKGYG